MKILGYFDSTALEILERLEVVEMAAGFLRAYLNNNSPEDDFSDLWGEFADNYSALVDAKIMSWTLQQVLRILKGK